MLSMFSLIPSKVDQVVKDYLPFKETLQLPAKALIFRTARECV